jgi:predicted O-methyltransferase YrrM
MAYQFTNNWFDSTARNVWDQLIPRVSPQKILEIGSYEGAATCYLIDRLKGSQLEIHCIDTWAGGVEHTGVNMSHVEARFHHNINTAAQNAILKPDMHIYKGYSDLELSRFLAAGYRNYFDFVYIDGSHQSPDVLCDAVLAFRLLRVGGVMAFDDYLWLEGSPQESDPSRIPKPAIDAFTNIYFRKIGILSAPLYQLYVQKLAD